MTNKMDLRVAALNRLCGWRSKSTMVDADLEWALATLSKLLGYRNWTEVKYAHQAEAGHGDITTTLKALLGPNGYTIYKMLEARHGDG